MSIVGKYIGAGDLREPITIQRFVETQSGTGGVILSPVTVVSTRAQVEPIRGVEAAQLAQAQAQADYRFWIRWRAGIAPQQRLVWRSQEFDILSVRDPGAEGRYLELVCKERFVGES
jgi:SPP1 family predicted phage head-tail adaptor